MPQGNPRGYRGQELEAMSHFVGLPQELIGQLLGSGMETPRSLLARAQGVSAAGLDSNMGQAMDFFANQQPDPANLARLRLLEQLLTSGSAGGAMGGGVPRGGGMSLNQVLSGQFSGSGR